VLVRILELVFGGFLIEVVAGEHGELHSRVDHDVCLGDRTGALVPESEGDREIGLVTRQRDRRYQHAVLAVGLHRKFGGARGVERQLRSIRAELDPATKRCLHRGARGWTVAIDRGVDLHDRATLAPADLIAVRRPLDFSGTVQDVASELRLVALPDGQHADWNERKQESDARPAQQLHAEHLANSARRRWNGGTVAGGERAQAGLRSFARGRSVRWRRVRGQSRVAGRIGHVDITVTIRES
jgi:hypothetical protein